MLTKSILDPLHVPLSLCCTQSYHALRLGIIYKPHCYIHSPAPKSVLFLLNGPDVSSSRRPELVDRFV